MSGDTFNNGKSTIQIQSRNLPAIINCNKQKRILLLPNEASDKGRYTTTSHPHST
jgi:hypothetical protein